MWQMRGMEDNAHEQPVMNYTAEGLICFLSAHETLGEERRLMGCRLTGWCFFGRSAL